MNHFGTMPEKAAYFEAAIDVLWVYGDPAPYRVAADTNPLRHPTARRYLAAMEALRGRRVAILPMVDREPMGQLPSQACKHLRKLCGRYGKLTA